MSLSQQDDVARNQICSVDGHGLAVAQDLRVRRQVGLQRLDGPFRLTFLDEREGCVQQDHRDDRPTEDWRSGDERQYGCGLKQDGQRMSELGNELVEPGALRAPGQGVAARTGPSDGPPRPSARPSGRLRRSRSRSSTGRSTSGARVAATGSRGGSRFTAVSLDRGHP